MNYQLMEVIEGSKGSTAKGVLAMIIAGRWLDAKDLHINTGMSLKTAKRVVGDEATRELYNGIVKPRTMQSIEDLKGFIERLKEDAILHDNEEQTEGEDG